MPSVREVEQQAERESAWALGLRELRRNAEVERRGKSALVAAAVAKVLERRLLASGGSEGPSVSASVQALLQSGSSAVKSSELQSRVFQVEEEEAGVAGQAQAKAGLRALQRNAAVERKGKAARAVAWVKSVRGAAQCESVRCPSAQASKPQAEAPVGKGGSVLELGVVQVEQEEAAQVEQRSVSQSAARRELRSAEERWASEFYVGKKAAFQVAKKEAER